MMKPGYVFRLFARLLMLCFVVFSAQPSIDCLNAQEPSPESDSTPALTIKVLEGENGINIIKKKTAVKPVVEVRDKNGLPVSGASVSFFLPEFSPTANFAPGNKILTLTTDAKGQAAVKSMSPLGEGKFSIRVTANYQGQMASTTITQTNYLTVSAAAAGGAAGGGAAVGVGSGISGTMIGAILGGLAAAAVAGVVISRRGGNETTSPHGTVSPGTGPTITRP